MKKKTQAEAEADAYSINLKLTSLYEGAFIKSSYKCLDVLCLFEFTAFPTNIKSGHGCPECNPRRALTQIEAEQYAKLQKLSLKSNYTNCHSYHLYECDVCFHNWPTRPNDIRHGSGCPQCAILLRTIYKNEECKKISSHLRSSFWRGLKGKNRKCSAIRDLGCTLEEFIIYIESKWLSGMNWENWSKYGWHMDHIKPLCRFDLENEEEQKRAVHYTNLQPLWAHDNLVKGGRYFTES